MKTSITSFAGLLCLLLCCSCSKDLNPEIIEYPDAVFTLSVTENRQRSHEFIWSHDDHGCSLYIDPSEQVLQELWITKWNECTLMADSSDALFKGVNFESEDPAIVAVEKIDAVSCRLIYVSDSGSRPVRINVFTGRGAMKKSFEVFSKEVIPLQHIMIRIGSQTILTPEQAEGDYSQRKVTKLDKIITDWSDPLQGEEIEIIGLCPENASWRFVKVFQTKYTKRYGYDFNDFSIKVMGYSDPFCKNGGNETNLDFSVIKGRKAWYAPNFGNTGVTCFYIPQNCFADDIRTAPLHIHYVLAEFSSL